MFAWILCAALAQQSEDPVAANQWFVAMQSTAESEYPSGRLTCVTTDETPSLRDHYEIHWFEWKDAKTACEYTHWQEPLTPDVKKLIKPKTKRKFVILRHPDKVISYSEELENLTVSTDLKVTSHYPPGICVRPDELWFRANGPNGPRWSVWQKPEKYSADKYKTTSLRQNDRLILERTYKEGSTQRFEIDSKTGCILKYVVQETGGDYSLEGNYEWGRSALDRLILKSCETREGPRIPSRRFTFKLTDIDTEFVPTEARFEQSNLKVKTGTILRQHTPSGLKTSRIGSAISGSEAIPFEKLIEKLRSNGFADPSRETERK